MRTAFIICSLLVFALLSYGLYQALVAAPTEATMGDVQRIFYYHVPSAWTAFLCFITNFLASILFLLRRSDSGDKMGLGAAIVFGVAGLGMVAAAFVTPYTAVLRPAGWSVIFVVVEYLLIRRFFDQTGLDALAVSAAEVGVVFCTVVLLTGPIWARPVWGIWWTWDARLTSTLILWLIYVSYLLLRRYATGSQTGVLAAALAVFGFLDVIFVYMAIRWFRTQHPQPVVGGGQGSGIDSHMLHALLMNFLAFAAYAALLLWLRYKLERTRHMVEDAHVARAVAGEGR